MMICMKTCHGSGQILDKIPPGADSNGLKYTLERARDTHYTVKTHEGRYLRVNDEGEIEAVTDINHLEMDRFLFRLI